MPFFEDKVEVKINVKPMVRDNFELALEKLGKSKEEAFEEFTSNLIAQALGAEGNSGPDNNPLKEYEESKLSERTVINRIKKWSMNPKGMPHKMIKSFLSVCLHLNIPLDESVDRFKMMGYFMALAECNEKKFESIFRQMCSRAERAYGDVFEFDRETRQVSLNRKYISFISSIEFKFFE